MRRHFVFLAIACGIGLSLTNEASAWGRRSGCGCAVLCGMPCVPCCPCPCGPCFSMHCQLRNPSGFVDPEQPIPFDVYITNWECYWWEFNQADYRFYVFDEFGRYIPNALRLPRLSRRIWVPPCSSIIDQPVAIRLHVGPDGVQLGKRYTLVVCLFDHCCSFHFIPLLERKGTGTTSLSLPATILVSLPVDATLTIDGHATRSTSSLRRFETPALPAGQEFTYKLRASVVRDGAERAMTQHVKVIGGKETPVNMLTTRQPVAIR